MYSMGETLEIAAMHPEPAPAPAPVGSVQLPPPPPGDRASELAWQAEANAAFPSTEEQLAALDPLVIKRARLSFVPKCTHLSCRGHILALAEYEPGEHNPPGYTRGWICDNCQFNSTYEPGTAMAMFRWVCHKYQTDLCRGCAQQQGIAQLLAGKSPTPSERKNKRRVDQNGEPQRRKRSKNLFSYAAFSKDKLKELQAERPTASAEGLKDEIKVAWQALTAEQKKPYRNRNADDDDDEPGTVVGKATGTPKPKKPRRQRGGVSAFNVFTKQALAKLRAENDDPNGALVKYTSQMSAMWAAMSAEDKKPYEECAETQTLERRAVDGAAAKGDSSKAPARPAAKRASRVLPKELGPGRVISAFNFYRKHHRELRDGKNPGADAGDGDGDGDGDDDDDFDVNSSWGALSDVEKQPWLALNAKDRARFDCERRAMTSEYLGAVDGLSAYATLSTASPSMITHFAANFNCHDTFRATGGLDRLTRRQRDVGNKRRSYAEPGDAIEGDDEARGPAGPVSAPPKRRSGGGRRQSAPGGGHKELGTRHNSRWQPDEIKLYIYCLRTFGKDYRRIHMLLNGTKSLTAVQSWYTNYRKKRSLDKMIAEGLRPEDEVVDLTLWGRGRLPPADQQPPAAAAAAAAGNADTTVNTFDVPARTSARSAARAVMARPTRGGGVLEDGESEDEVTEQPEENEKMLPGPVGSQVLGSDGRPIAPSTNPRHYCGFCCRVELPVNLVSCVECGNSGHQNCLEFNDRLWNNVKRDPTWTCIECKACSVCKSPDEEEKMLFCEACDRGFHMFCLKPPLKTMPDANESWQCPSCTAEEVLINQRKAAEAAAAAAAADAEAAAAAAALSPDRPGVGNASGGVALTAFDWTVGTPRNLAPTLASTSAVPVAAGGPAENEETDGTHATIAGFYYDVVMRKYLPRKTAALA